jgi:hypothetical protein
MCAITFAITCYGLVAPEWVESYHSHLAIAAADE